MLVVVVVEMFLQLPQLVVIDAFVVSSSEQKQDCCKVMGNVAFVVVVAW